MAYHNMLSEIQVNERVRAWCFRVKILRINSFKVFGNGPFSSYILADEAGSKTTLIIAPSDADRFKGLEKEQGNWVEISRVEVQDAFTGFKPVNCPFRLSVIEEIGIKLIPHPNDYHYMEFKSIHQIKYITNTNIPIDIMGGVFNVEPLEVSSKDPKRTNIVFYIRDNIENQIKCVATENTAYGFRDGYENTLGLGVVILVLNMWRICRGGDAEPWLKTHKGLSDFRFNPRMIEVDDFKRELANNDPYVARHCPIMPM